MRFVKFILILFIYFEQLSCSSPKVYATFSDWDSDSDKQITRKEFVAAYSNLDYFDKWGHGKNSITYPEFFMATFESMDNDHNNAINSEEFSSQIKLFFFNMYHATIEQWDDDSSNSLSKDEFVKHIATTNFASLWDNNSDKRISKNEMAGGMFYVCDTNNDLKVDEVELTAWKKNR